MNLRSGIMSIVPEREGPPRAELSGDILTIDCRGCAYVPMPGSRECLGCMVDGMCRAGGADRVVLRTGRDTEISGRAGRAVKEAASLRRWSLPQGPPQGRCRACPVSRYEILTRAWERFPVGMTDGLAAEALSGVPERKGCRECVEATVRALGQIDEGMGRIQEEMTGRAVP